jgi:hypothetical protein
MLETGGGKAVKQESKGNKTVCIFFLACLVQNGITSQKLTASCYQLWLQYFYV